jgi:hypothetical protein
MALSATVRAREPEVDRSRRDAQFAVLTEQVPAYSLTLANSQTSFELVPDPLLRWSNPLRDTPDGAVFLWTRDGRAAAIMCAFWRNDREYKHEFQSLSDGPVEMTLDGESVWAPQEPGVTSAADPDSLAVARKRSLRLTQMRRIARQYTASVGSPDEPVRELRLLPQPLYRYKEQVAAPGVVDGAVFAWVESTDPEILLLLEARSDADDQNRWHVAFARMSRWRQFVTYNGQTVWSCEWVAGSANEPYVVLSYSAGDSE